MYMYVKKLGCLNINNPFFKNNGSFMTTLLSDALGIIHRTCSGLSNPCTPPTRLVTITYHLSQFWRFQNFTGQF